MRDETFVSYRKYLWLWVNLALVGALVVWYLIDDPYGGKNGGTSYGYSVGILAAVAIVYLMWFGIRKRSYSAYRVTLKGWLAAHVWLGMALVIIVPLHSGFLFGWNVHTAAYVVMVLVVASGIWGATNYRLLPPETMSNRGGGSLSLLADELRAIDTEIDSVVRLDPSVRTQVATLDRRFSPKLLSCLLGSRTPPLDRTAAADLLQAASAAEREAAVRAIDLIGKKRMLMNRFEGEVAVRAKLKLWLYCHIPLSLGLVLLVAIHVFSVLYF